jgi:tRNA1Val (adenine37-N6)-methyltransferase
MSNGYFRFKQFTVWHDRCAMKVGTDGVLLGASVRVEKSRRVLDIGTGTGLVALMIAQRCPAADITAVEIVEEAALQAQSNVDASPWSNRVHVVQSDFKEFASEERFDTIVSNPPYFSGSLLPPDKHRTSARHTTELDFTTLLSHAAELLTADGEITLIIPTMILAEVERIGQQFSLHSVRRLSVVTRHGVEPKRTVVTLSFRSGTCEERTLCMEGENRVFTDEYRRLVGDFYLNI